MKIEEVINRTIWELARKYRVTPVYPRNLPAENQQQRILARVDDGFKTIGRYYYRTFYTEDGNLSYQIRVVDTKAREGYIEYGLFDPEHNSRAYHKIKVDQDLCQEDVSYSYVVIYDDFDRIETVYRLVVNTLDNEVISKTGRFIDIENSTYYDEDLDDERIIKGSDYTFICEYELEHFDEDDD